MQLLLKTAILRLFHLTDGFNLGKKAFRIIELIHLFAKKGGIAFLFELSVCAFR